MLQITIEQAIEILSNKIGGVHVLNTAAPQGTPKELVVCINKLDDDEYFIEKYDDGQPKIMDITEDDVSFEYDISRHKLFTTVDEEVVNLIGAADIRLEDPLVLRRFRTALREFKDYIKVYDCDGDLVTNDSWRFFLDEDDINLRMAMGSINISHVTIRALYHKRYKEVVAKCLIDEVEEATAMYRDVTNTEFHKGDRVRVKNTGAYAIVIKDVVTNEPTGYAYSKFLLAFGKRVDVILGTDIELVNK